MTHTDNSEIIIKALRPTRAELLRYIHFGTDLYKGNDCFVPPLIVDELETLDPRRNPASEQCESQSFLALRGGKPVGRITAIINNEANRRFGSKTLRFGWVDFVDSPEVVDALFAAAADWGRSRGMTEMVGPMGFTDMDHEGMLVDGFNEMGTMATIYNYPYYPEHMQRMGFEKDADWIEFRLKVPDAVPEKMQRISDIVSRKFGLHSVRVSSKKELKEKYGHAFFHLINEAYADLYGFVPLTERMIDSYVNTYLSILRLDDLSIIVDEEGRLAAAGISMPSLSKALRRSGGKLVPTGWWHLLRAINGRGVDVVDLMLVAVRKDLLGKGVNSMLFTDLIPRYISHGYKWAESNVELETNASVQKQWEYFEYRQHRRRRAWRKKL
ncbi:MAG: N-acetyltransferase [Muribaculaceae bacterium]|nr:N-acetyltransferase [Muribaculaceae bacterium]